MNTKRKLLLTIPLALTITAQAAPKTKPPAKADAPAATESHEETYGAFNIGGFRWMPDKGFMLTPGKPYKSYAEFEKNSPFDNEETHYYDTRRALPYGMEDGTCVTWRLQNEFKANNVQAKDATFKWTKDSGADGFWNVDAAIRLDFWIPGLYRPDGAEASVAFGYEIHRNDDPGGLKDIQTWHLGLPFVDKWLFGNLPLLDTSDQVWQVDVSYQQDGLTGKDGFSIDTDYEPTIRIGKKDGKCMWFGTRCALANDPGNEIEFGAPLDPSELITVPYYSLTPKGGISYGSKYTLGSPIVTPDDEFVGSYSLTAAIGAPLGRTKNVVAELEVGIMGGTILSGGGSFQQEHATLSFKQQTGNPLSLNFTYVNGQSDFGATDLDRFEATLGIRF